jgi:predicted lipoprotein with Yx(FWY)xxD motif
MTNTTPHTSPDAILRRRHRAGSRRRTVRMATVPVLLGAAALTLAACGSSTSNGAATTTSSGNTGANSGAGTTTTSGASTTSATVHAATTSVGRVLENSSDMPLYTFGPDGTGTTSKCTGACIQAWPPLTVPAGTMPTGSGVSGTFGTAKQANGAEQVTYNGKLLYTFLSDSPGKVTGNGVASFSVVMVSSGSSGTAAGSGGGSSPASTTATTSGGYQY